MSTKDQINDGTIPLMKVAIVYDRINKWGGAERVLLALHEMFPEAPLFTSVYSDKHAEWANVFPEIHTSFLQKIPFAKTRHELLPLFMPIAFETFNFDEYDLVISVTSEAAKGIITKGKTKHICYCLTPTRYLWSGYEEYFGKKEKKQMLKNIWGQVHHGGLRLLSKPAVNYLRKWDVIAAKRPDVMIGISKEVQDRIRKYYNRESHLVYPPVGINRFKNYDLRMKQSLLSKDLKNEARPGNIYIDSRLRGNDDVSLRNDIPQNYFLVVSRLVPYKKVDLVVETFNELQLPLIIVGTGSQEKKLKRKAGSTIHFTDHISDTELSDYYQGAKAFIFPQEEDFGITAVEAQAHGLPVIAFKKGGALDTVVHGKTGVFFEEQTAESLQHAIKRLNNLRFKKDDLRTHAKKFSKEKFKTEFMKIVSNIR
jgi:glycosyltransferase involved in cell wall biosynthesis